MALTALLNFAYNVWCARSLGRAHYADLAAALGIVAILAYALNPLALVMAQLASVFHTTGDSSRVVWLYHAMQRRLRSATLLALIPAIPLALAAAWVFRFETSTNLFLAVGMVAVLLPLAVTRATLRATRKLGSFTLGLVVEAFARLALGAGFLLISPTASSALAAYLIASLVIYLAQDSALRKSWRGMDASEQSVKPWNGLIVPGWALLIWYAFAQNTDLLIVKSLADREDAGVYAAAATVARSLMMVLTLPLDAVLLPRLGSSPGRPRAAAAPVALLFFAVWIPPVAASVFFPDAIVNLVFGPAFAGAASLLPWLVIASMCMSASYLTGQALLFIRNRAFLFFAFAALALEIGLIILVAGDASLTVRTVLAAQAAIAVGMMVLWTRASADREREERAFRVQGGERDS
ncbi:MAG: hypothetical protein ABR517_05120 [Thermoanaerobaculia bacterium]